MLAITDRAVICLNLVDEAERSGLLVDDRRLARDLGVPVVADGNAAKPGLDELLAAVNEVATGRFVGHPTARPVAGRRRPAALWTN